MIVALVLIGFLSIVFGVYFLAKEKNLLAAGLFFIGIALYVAVYIAAHLYPQLLPVFLRSFQL
jgi:heme O synthase-like polyprenyltransferase